MHPKDISRSVILKSVVFYEDYRDREWALTWTVKSWNKDPLVKMWGSLKSSLSVAVGLNISAGKDRWQWVCPGQGSGW